MIKYLVSIFVFVSIVKAEPTQVRLTGGSVSFKIESLTPGKELDLYGVSKGNSSNPIKINVYGIPGVTIKASGAKVSNSIKSTLKDKKAFYPITLRDEKEAEAYHSECIEFSPGDALSEDEPPFDPNSIVSVTDPFCDQFSSKEIEALSEALTDTYGGEWDAGRVCGYLLYMFKGSGDETFPTESARLAKAKETQSISKDYLGLLSKDACGKKNDSYIFRLKVKLPKKLPASGYFRVRIFETSYDGSKASTIKPVSDGKFAPSPILLMSQLGFCGQRLNINKWSNNRLIKMSAYKVFDLIMYQDLVLARTPISSYLTGGKGTFELFDQNSGYGVCFQLEATRQRAFGYPG